MLEVCIPKYVRDNAIRRDIECGEPFKGASISEGKGRFYGFLGEEIVKHTIPELVHECTKDYDFRFQNVTFDVKTKTRKDAPRSNFDATVDGSAFHQQNNVYIFVQILAPQGLIYKDIDSIRSFEYTKAWILGFLPKTMFYEKARYFKAGSVDPTNNLKYRDNIHLVRCDELVDISELIDAVSIISNCLK